MSHDPYDRYDRASRFKANYSKLFDSFADSDTDNPGEIRRSKKRKNRAKLGALDLIDEDLDLLPSRHKEVVEMLLKGFTVKEVAEDRGVTPSAIEKIVKSARRLIEEAK